MDVFLDIHAAFDTIEPEALREALHHRGGDPIMVQWYY